MKRKVCVGRSQKEQEKRRDISREVSEIKKLLIQFREVL